LDTDAIHGAKRVIGAHAVKVVDPGLREDTGEERADHAADTVELEDVHALIDLDPLVDVLAEGADGAGEETNESGNPEGNVSSSRSDTDETGDSTRASTHNGEMALGTDVLYHNPAEHTERGSGVGVEGSDHRADGAVERTTSIEAEPSKPDEHGSNEDECGVVGFSVNLVALVETLAEDKGVGERRPSGCDVDGTTSGEVKGRKVEQPTVSVTELADVRRFSDI